MMRNKYAALLDLDGTLIDSLHIYYIAVSKVLSSFGVSCTYEEMFKLAGASGEELYTHFLKEQDMYDPSDKAKLKEIFENSFYAELGSVSFPEESIYTIYILKDRGYKVAICTGASRLFVDTVLPKSLIGVMDSIVTCDDVSVGKPHPETFLKAADEVGIHPSNCVVVGDSSNDMIGSERAGMSFVLVRNKYNTHINEGYVREIGSIEEFID